jgi:Bacterial SH3 domain
MYSNWDPTKAGQPQSAWAKPGHYDLTNAGRSQVPNHTFGPSAVGSGQPPGLSSLPSLRGSTGSIISGTEGSDSVTVGPLSGRDGERIGRGTPQDGQRGDESNDLIWGSLAVIFIVFVLGAALGDNKNHSTPGQSETSERTQYRPDSPATSTAKYAAVTAINLNLRQGPGVGYDVITTIPKGRRAKIISVADNGWFEVEASGGGGQTLHGYANGKLMSVE